MTESKPAGSRWAIGTIIGRAWAFLIVAWLAWQLWPVWLKPGPSTTVVTEPRRPDGTIDYAAALNAECSQGVTPENNAVVLLVRAMGPVIFDAQLAPAYFQEIGIENLPAEGAYLQPLETMFPEARDRQLRIRDDFEAAFGKPWSDEDYPDLAQWLAVNEEPLNLCVAATKRERFYDPLVRRPGATLLETLFPVMQQSRGISRLLSLRAMRRLQQGNIDAALDDSEAMYRLSRLAGQHPLLIPRLVAHAHQAMACAVDGQIAQSAQLTSHQAQRHREFLKSLPPFSPIADLIDRGERLQTLDTVQLQFLGPQWTVGWMEPNAFLRTFNTGYDDIVAAMQEPDVEMRGKALSGVEYELSKNAKFDGSVAGRIVLNPRRQISTQVASTLMMLLVGSFDQASNSELRVQIKHELSQLGFAVAAYRVQHGEYPATLDALVPDFLHALPADLYASGPYQYILNRDRNTFLLYSLGQNGTDDHGLMSGRSKADDIGFGDVPKEE